MAACFTGSMDKNTAILWDAWDIWAMELLLLEEGGEKSPI